MVVINWIKHVITIKWGKNTNQNTLDEHVYQYRVLHIYNIVKFSVLYLRKVYRLKS